MANTNVAISPPWLTFFREIRELFSGDSEVTVDYDDDKKEIKLRVDNEEKAEALSKILPTERDFGGVIVTIMVVPANKAECTREELFRKAFKGNDNVVEIFSVPDEMAYSPTYVIFKKEVVQFYNDNMGDAHGNTSTLHQEIAKDIFRNAPGILFCTDNEGKVGR